MSAHCPLFACPTHKTPLAEDFYCALCDKNFPSADGIPILINEENSIFRSADYLRGNAYGGASAYAGNADTSTGLKRFYRRAVLRLSEAGPPLRDYGVEQAVTALLQANPNAEILVIGAGESALKGRITYTDVAFGKNVHCIADAHDLPFTAMSFDACIAVAVLEHVLDPYRCVQEIIRVLRPGGYVYAETPFLQPVHMGAHDFTRFSYLGHRRLFRNFDEVRSGVAGGPGTSLSQLLRYAIAALSDRPGLRRWLKLAALLVAFPLRWIDYLCHDKKGAYDAASAFYFFGTLRETPISDRELLQGFRGA